MKVYPISEKYIEKAIVFDIQNKYIINKIKDIFFQNIEEDEIREILSISNKYINNYDLNVVKDYVSISMIKSKLGSFEIILFIPTKNDIVKKKVLDFIKQKKYKHLSSSILFDSIYSYL